MTRLLHPKKQKFHILYGDELRTTTESKSFCIAAPFFSGSAVQLYISAQEIYRTLFFEPMIISYEIGPKTLSANRAKV